MTRLQQAQQLQHALNRIKRVAVKHAALTEDPGRRSRALGVAVVCEMRKRASIEELLSSKTAADPAKLAKSVIKSFAGTVTPTLVPKPPKFHFSSGRPAPAAKSKQQAKPGTEPPVVAAPVGAATVWPANMGPVAGAASTPSKWGFEALKKKANENPWLPGVGAAGGYALYDQATDQSGQLRHELEQQQIESEFLKDTMEMQVARGDAAAAEAAGYAQNQQLPTPGGSGFSPGNSAVANFLRQLRAIFSPGVPEDANTGEIQRAMYQNYK